jgi:two-component system sensor histidine kinase MtrB
VGPGESPDGPYPVRSTRRPRRTRLSEGLGLRARVTATFAIGAFALSTLMAGITYFTARQTYLNERQGADQRQVFANALLVQNALRSPGADADQLIGSAGPLPGSLSVLHSGGHWYATSISVGQSALPESLQALVLKGTPASQIISVGAAPQLAIGVPLPAVHAAYFEFFSLDELEGTLRTLAFTRGGTGTVGQREGPAAAGRGDRGGRGGGRG